MLSSASQQDRNTSMTPGKRAFRSVRSELKVQTSDLEFTSYDVGRWNTCFATISTTLKLVETTNELEKKLMLHN